MLSEKALVALRAALFEDDPRLMQGDTLIPLIADEGGNAPVRAACALGFCLWQGDGIERVGWLLRHFAELCVEIDDHLGERAGCRWFVNWDDETPREQMRAALLPEVDLALAARTAPPAPLPAPVLEGCTA